MKKKPNFAAARPGSAVRTAKVSCHRSWIKNQGYPEDLFDGRPVIGICNTWSELDALQRAFPRAGRSS